MTTNQTTELRDVKAFGVLSQYSSGRYEVFIEEYEGEQFRFDFGFEELWQLANLALALLPREYFSE